MPARQKFPVPAFAEVAAREPANVPLLAAIAANREYRRNPLTGAPLTVRERFESECG